MAPHGCRGTALLNDKLFFGLDHARQATTESDLGYNTGPPHMALDYELPASLPNSRQQGIQLSATLKIVG
jgi:transposase InsO family protein